MPACSSPGCLGGCSQTECRSCSPRVCHLQRHLHRRLGSQCWAPQGGWGRLSLWWLEAQLCPPSLCFSGCRALVEGWGQPTHLPLCSWPHPPQPGLWCQPREVRQKYYQIHFGEKITLKYFTHILSTSRSCS